MNINDKYLDGPRPDVVAKPISMDLCTLFGYIKYEIDPESSLGFHIYCNDPDVRIYTDYDTLLIVAGASFDLAVDIEGWGTKALRFEEDDQGNPMVREIKAFPYNVETCSAIEIITSERMAAIMRYVNSLFDSKSDHDLTKCTTKFN